MRCTTLCAKHGLGAPHLTIPIMKVIGSHKATTEEEVIQLITQHDGKFCRDCRSKGNGTIKDWAEVMYETQKTLPQICILCVFFYKIAKKKETDIFAFCVILLNHLRFIPV